MKTSHVWAFEYRVAVGWSSPFLSSQNDTWNGDGLCHPFLNNGNGLLLPSPWSPTTGDSYMEQTYAKIITEAITNFGMSSDPGQHIFATLIDARAMLQVSCQGLGHRWPSEDGMENIDFINMVNPATNPTFRLLVFKIPQRGNLGKLAMVCYVLTVHRKG